MNFYKHHLGDYAAATSHLSWDEDCAYRRLIDQYYKREAALPAEVKDACRLARASTPAQRRAVDTVLREFFTLQDDGWHQKRCDIEIGSANAQAETNRRIAEEREAKKRARIEHESLHVTSNESNTNRSPATSGEREPSQTPDSRLHKPDSRLKAHSSALPPSVAQAPDFAPPEANGHQPTPAGTICRAMRRAGMAATNPGDPRLLALIEQGATEAEFEGLAAEAVGKGKGFPWVLSVLQSRRTEAAAIVLAPVASAGTITQPSNAADRTQDYLREQFRPLTPEEKAKADEARKRAMAAVGRSASP